eukprot:2444544-Alexandrium_andersonii.AAC.1
MPRFGGGESTSSGGANFNHRQPPSWNPEFELNYSFRAWVQDLQLWMMVTDLQPYQQAAAVVLRPVSYTHLTLPTICSV